MRYSNENFVCKNESKEKDDVTLKTLIHEAFNMHLYYEEKYYTFMMVTYDDDKRYNALLDGIKQKSEYWRRMYEKLIRMR